MEIVVTKEQKLVKKTKKPVKVSEQGIFNEYGECEITYADFFKLFDGKDVMITVVESTKEDIKDGEEYENQE